MGNFILKYKYPIAFLIFLVHYFFKTYALGINGFWYDECYSVYVSADTIEGIIKSTQTGDPNPPLYLIFLHYWVEIFGDSEFGVRLLSVVASCFSAAILFLLCLRFFNWQTAIFASVMFLTSNELYYYAQEARAFSLVILFVILSNYFFLSILYEPKWRNIFLLGICNSVIFYLHILATFSVLAQAVCLPFVLLNFNRVKTAEDTENINFSLKISKKALLYYFLSFIVFILALIPWKDRLRELVTEGGKSWWLAKPTIREFKDCIYDFFNSKDLYQVCVFSFLVAILVIIIFKKLREEGFNRYVFLYSLITGPLLIYLMYIVAGFSPIFLKRYVLFTIIGFITLFAYVFSMLRLSIYVKLTFFFVLGYFMMQKVVFPRPVLFEYNKAAAFFNKIKASDTFIYSDQQDLLTYYYAKECFYIRQYEAKNACLFDKGIFTPIGFDLDWPERIDFSNYKHIYFTNSFHSMMDPTHKVENALRRKFILKDEIEFYKGLHIKHYINPDCNTKIKIATKDNKAVGEGNDKMIIAGEGINGEEFTRVKLKDKKYAFISSKHLFFSANLANVGELLAVAEHISDWEKFELIELPDGYVAIKAFNGKYLSQDEKTHKLIANSSVIGSKEKFKITVVK